MRENTDQFFAAVTRKRSGLESSSLPVISTNFSRQDYRRSVDIEVAHQSVTTALSSLKPLSSIRILPSIRVSTNKSSQCPPGNSARGQRSVVPSAVHSSGLSLQSSIPIMESPSPMERHPVQIKGPVDRDIFRKAYDRALSVARSRLLFRDPYSLTRANATHGVLYSYYDHTPMCVFTRGAACDHRQHGTSRKERKLKVDTLRKNIFNDVIVEHYIS